MSTRRGWDSVCARCDWAQVQPRGETLPEDVSDLKRQVETLTAEVQRLQDRNRILEVCVLSATERRMAARSTNSARNRRTDILAELRMKGAELCYLTGSSMLMAVSELSSVFPRCGDCVPCCSDCIPCCGDCCAHRIPGAAHCMSSCARAECIHVAPL